MADSWRSSKRRAIDYNHLGYNKPATALIAQLMLMAKALTMSTAAFF